MREFAVGYLQNPQLSPDGKILAGLGSQYGPIELWDVATGRQLRSWKSNGEYIWCLTFSLDGKTLATGGADKIIRFWEVASGKLRRGIGTPNIVKKIALSGDGALAASLGMTKIESGAVSVFPPENQIRVWDVLTGKELRQLAMSAQKRPLREPEGFCNLSFAPDGKTLVTTGADGAVRFWDPAKGKELRHYNLGTKGELKMAFAADGKKLALAGGTIQVIDVASGKETVQLPGHSLGISAAALTPDGRIAITASYEQPILLWDPATGREVGRIEAPQGAIESFRILDSGRTLLTCSSDNMIGFWDLAERKEGRQFALPAGAPNWVPHMLAVSSDGKTLALAGTGNILALLDLETGKELRQLKGDVWISGAAFAPDGRTIAVWYGDHTVQVWDVTTGQMVRRFPFAEEFNAARGAPPRVIAPGDKSSFSYIAGASPDGRLIAYGSQFRYLVLHELASGKEARSLDHLPDGVSAVAFSPDSKMLAWGGWNDPAVHLVEVATGQERHHLGGHKGRITSLSFSVDGQSLISGGQDTATVVWDLTGKLAAKKKWGGLLSAQDLYACWTDLACDAAARAFQAIRRLAASPTEAIPYLREHLKPVPAVDEKRLVRLIVDLDSNQFDVRESATKEMEKLGELAAPACRKALEQKPFAEARRRLEALIEKQNREWQDPSTEQLRALRALEVLEHIGNQEASQIVASLANGAPEARLTQQAKASKERLAKRLSVAP